LKHDPERNAAAYLGGLLKGARRRMFERHMVGCEDCWREVDLGRKGRSVAESAREIAPQALRERVRMVVETVRPPTRRPPWVFGVGALLLMAAVVASFALVQARDPREISAVVTAFRDQQRGTPERPRLPTRLGNLELVNSGRTDVGGIDAIVHTYVDPSGDEVVVFVADKEWPIAAGAEHDNAGETWTAQKDGLVMICVDEPAPSLVVGDDMHDVELAAYTLRP